MDDNQIITICERLFQETTTNNFPQRSAINAAAVPKSTIKKSVPKLKKPVKLSFKQHFHEASDMSAKDFADLLGGEKQKIIKKYVNDLTMAASHHAGYGAFENRNYRLRNAAAPLHTFYKSPVYRHIVYKALVDSGINIPRLNKVLMQVGIQPFTPPEK